MLLTNKRKNGIIFFILLFLGVCLLNCWWILRDVREIHRTEVPKFIVAQCYYGSQEYPLSLNYFPPGYFFTSTSVCKLLHIKFNYTKAVLFNFIYIVVAMIGVYMIGRYLFGHGLLSVLVLLSFPAYLYCSKKFIMEISVVPWVILAVYFIMKNRGWQNVRYAVFLGFISGIGLLFKWTFSLYVFGPFLISIFDAFLHKNLFPRHRVLINMFLCSFTVCLVCGWWYAFYFSPSTWIKECQGHWQWLDAYTKSYWDFLTGNLKMIVYILIRNVSVLFVCFFAAGFLLNKKKWTWSFKETVLFSWFIFPCIFFCVFVSEPAPRYFLPFMPSLALGIMIIIENLAFRFKKIFMGILIVLSLYNIGYETFLNRPPQRDISLHALWPIFQLVSYSPSRRLVPAIAFNGLYDDDNYGEVEDIFCLFLIYKWKHHFPFEISFFKKNDSSQKFFNYDYIVSQATQYNRYLHRMFVKKGYKQIMRFRHRYSENTDSTFDWESNPEYILFKRSCLPQGKM